MHFIINNITSMNIEQKVKELKGIVAREYWPWFANYLVVKRAAQVHLPARRRLRRAAAARTAGHSSASLPCRAPYLYPASLLSTAMRSSIGAPPQARPLAPDAPEQHPPPPPASQLLQEPNFHGTYVLLVDKWGEREMRDTLVSTTVHYIKVGGERIACFTNSFGRS